MLVERLPGLLELLQNSVHFREVLVPHFLEKAHVLSLEHLGEAPIFLWLIGLLGRLCGLLAADEPELIEVGDQGGIVTLGQQTFDHSWQLVQGVQCNFLIEYMLQELVKSKRCNAASAAFTCE